LVLLLDRGLQNAARGLALVLLIHPGGGYPRTWNRR